MRVVTAADSEAQQRRVAGALAARGVRRGDRVVLTGRNRPEVLAAVLGALRSGVVPVPLNAQLLPAERDLLVADADPALVLDDTEVDALLTGPEAELAPWPLARPMHYTSGTTGRPKGVWSGILDEVAAAALLAEERDLWTFGPDDVHLVCSPLSHSAPIRFAAGTLLAGGSVLVLPRFDPTVFAEAVARHRPTTAFVAPAHLQRVFAAPDLPDLGSFRLLAHAGAACPVPVKERALAAFPEGSVWEFYGSTEGQFTACSPDDWRARPGTVGRARPGRRLRVDDDGHIWCRVPEHARFAYWRDPAKTADAWQGDEFTVSDLGRLDPDGYLYLDGRRDDLVISGGVNVYPLEVEQTLATLPGVEDVAVFGVDDETWGQRVCAAVVGRVTPTEVDVFARARLAAYKRPKDVYVVPEIPRTTTGKVRRSRLGEELGVIFPTR
jgi:long-chain acyl-CoA synthetase